MPQLTLRQYGSIFVAIVVLIGLATYFLAAPSELVEDLFTIAEPSELLEANDEFISLAFTFTAPSARFGAFVDGNFWLVLTPTRPDLTKGDTAPKMAPFYPREIPKLYVNDATNAVRFGENDFALDTAHTFSGYAYISPSDVFDGEYEARVLFMRTEEGKSPQHLAESDTFPLSVKRVFNLQHNLIIAQVPTEVKRVGDEWSLMSLNVRAVSDDIVIRAFEIGAPSVRRVSDAVSSLALYDTATGEMVSKLTDTKVSALTLEKYTAYVLDTPTVVNSQFTRTFEIRGRIDESLLHTDRSILFALVRVYGINTDQQKIAESTPDIGVRITLPRQ